MNGLEISSASATLNQKKGLGAWDWEAISNTANDVLKLGQQAATTVQAFKQPSVPATYIPSSPYGMMDPLEPPAKPPMSTGTKVLIGGVGLVLVGGIVYAVSRKKGKKKS